MTGNRTRADSLEGCYHTTRPSTLGMQPHGLFHHTLCTIRFCFYGSTTIHPRFLSWSDKVISCEWILLMRGLIILGISTSLATSFVMYPIHVRENIVHHGEMAEICATFSGVCNTSPVEETVQSNKFNNIVMSVTCRHSLMLVTSH